jgi:hypothetical protein
MRCEVYEIGRVAAGPGALRLLAQFSERELEEGAGVHRSRIRLLRHDETVTRKMYRKIKTFLLEHFKDADNRYVAIFGDEAAVRTCHGQPLGHIHESCIKLWGN